MDWFEELLLIIVFLLLKGFFSGSEIAIVNSDKVKLRHQAKMGNRGAALVLKLFRTPDVILGTTLVGTNLATVTISTLGALIFIDLFGKAGDLISVAVLTPVLLILGEVVPKSIFQQKADTISSRIIYTLRFFLLSFLSGDFRLQSDSTLYHPHRGEWNRSAEYVYHPGGVAGAAGCI